MRIENWRRHSLGRFIGGVPEHESLIACTEHTIKTVDTLADVRRLTVEQDAYFASIRINSGFSGGVAGFAQNAPHQCLRSAAHFVEDILGDGFEFTCDKNKLISEHGFASDASLWVSLKKGVQNSIGNAIRELIRVPFRNRFR
jgi:hypothetical protein